MGDASDDEWPLSYLYFTAFEEVEKNPRVHSEFLEDVHTPPSSKNDKDLTGQAPSSGTKSWYGLDMPKKKAKKARERQDNNLDPGIKRGPWTEQEDSILSKAHEQYGNKWTSISRLIPGRTDNAVKNRYYSALKAKKENSPDDEEKENSPEKNGKTEKGKTESLPHEKDYSSSSGLEISDVLMSPTSPEDLFKLQKGWKSRAELPELTPDKVQLMCDYCRTHDAKEVPDPYYGGPQGFEEVLDLLEDACEGLLESIVREESLIFYNQRQLLQKIKDDIVVIQVICARFFTKIN